MSIKKEPNTQDGKHVLPAEPSLIDVLIDLWHAKFYVITGLICGLVCGLLFLSVSIPQYKASMMIAPADRKGGQDIKALLPDNSSFAVQYLVNSIGSADSHDYVRFEHILTEHTIAALLIEDPVIQEGIRQAQRFTLFQNEERPQTPSSVSDYLQKSLTVETVGNTPLRRIHYHHPDPEFAVYFLQRIYDVTDNLIKEDIRSKTETRASYLAKTLADARHPDHKRALTSLLMEQEHLHMILAMDEPFAALIAEAPAAGPKPEKPRKAIVLSIFMFLGLFTGYTTFAIRRSLKTKA